MDFVSCDTNGMSLEAIFKSLFVKNSAGANVGIRMVVVPVAACADVQDAVACDNPLTSEELFRQSIVLDTCGKPALRMYDTTLAT